MEQKINIAEILKDKPQGTKLYNLLYNIDAELDTIVTTGTKTIVWCTDKIGNTDVCHRFYSEFGTIEGYPDGLQILLPSKKMRDWNKFAWKKGDLLINSCGFQCIFKEWSSDDYTKFNGCYSNSRDGYEDVSNAETAKFVKLDNNTAYGYVREIERKLGGILNLETLEIEKAQPEFKDGDIITFKDRIIIIYNTSIEKSPERTEIYYHACLKEGELTVNEYLMSCGFGEGWYSATEEEKHNIFEALAKKGKAWDSEKKKVVNLKPRFDELKPFDKVVVRWSEADRWSIAFFSYKVHNGYICTGDAWFGYCLPYNDETAHLLGTTDDWKGGEE